ncbi:23S rRNA (guanosine(2251)-2'-O)-methyltransferase RlmB [soil metagenome]
MEKRKAGNLNFKQSQNFENGPNPKDLVFGTRAVIETIRSGKEIDKLLIQKGLSNDLINELIKLASSLGIPYSKVPVEKLNRITRKNHQGAISFLSAINYASLDNVISECFSQGKSPFLIILDRITDVRNFGAVARTAECAGVDAIIIPGKGSAQITSDAMKTSAGALNFIPVCREDNLKITINYLKESGIQIIACTEKAEKSIFEMDFNHPTAIILGSEEDGISPEYLRLASDKSSIPTLGHIESLNVSVAAAVVLYEGVRQRKKH